MSVNAPAWREKQEVTATERDNETRSTRRSLLFAGSALGTILLTMAGLTAQPLPAVILKPSEVQLGQAAQLFHGPLPSLAALPVLSLEIVVWSGVVGLWLIYLWVVWHLRARSLDLRWVAWGAVALSLLGLALPPLFSTDIFSYAMFGRLAGVYDLNPYVSTANQATPTDPLLPYVFWRDIASPYGPLWSLISSVVAHGAATPPLVQVMRFKLVAFAAVMLDGALVYRLVRVRWPDEASWAYLAFAWNPLVLIDGIAAGHNDVVILALLLASAILLVQLRPVWAIFGLTASSLIKYSTLPLVGVAMVRTLFRLTWRQRTTFVGRVTVLVLPLVVVAFLPFWAGRRGLMSTVDEPGRGTTNPLLRLVGWGMTWLSHGHVSLASPVAAVGASMLLFGTWQIHALWRDRSGLAAATPNDELAAWGETLAMFLFVWPRIHTWYVLVPLGLALAAGPNHRRLYGQVLILTLLSYLTYV